MKPLDVISLQVYRHRFEGIAEEMGEALKRSSFSPNIKERLDFSCAIFDRTGRMVAQAAHIPVHLGAMPESVDAARAAVDQWSAGDVVVLNDPHMGGSHLPDLTMISPLIQGTDTVPMFFVATRAHHSDIGGMAPGSLPLSTEIFQEGLILPPVLLVKAGAIQNDILSIILRNVRTPSERQGDLAAQIGANTIGVNRLLSLISKHGPEEVNRYASGLLNYSESRMRAAIEGWKDGESVFTDDLEVFVNGERASQQLRVKTCIAGDKLSFDFEGSSASGPHPFNAVLAITKSACYYVVRCLTSDDIPVNDGCFRSISIRTPIDSIVDASFPAAVSAGNVETSQRIVDTVLGSFAPLLPNRIPSASQGTMNNVLMGSVTNESNSPYVYYETIAGGSGASPASDGASCIHIHMTNTLNTPIEVFETEYPVRVSEYARRRGSGGRGTHAGGDGVVREFEFLEATRVTMQSTRRTNGPWGLAGGENGKPGRNLHIDVHGSSINLPSQFSRIFQPNERLRIETPGGGGWGPA